MEKKWLINLVPFLMVLVFSNQIFLNFFGTLNPWKGGGFGMFASVESPGTRILQSYGITENGDTINISINISDIDSNNKFERDIVTKLRSKPSASKMETLAKDMACLRFIKTSENFNRVKKYLGNDVIDQTKKATYRPVKIFEIHEDLKTIKLSSIIISVYEVKFNTSSLELSRSLLLSPVKAEC